MKNIGTCYGRWFGGMMIDRVSNSTPEGMGFRNVNFDEDEEE